MHFAKLFDFTTGQLLVTLRESEAREEADAPFQLVLETRNALDTTMRLAYGYASEAKRDEEFAALDVAQADGHYGRMQTTLLNALAA